MNINWKVRLHNPVFIWQIILAVLVPIVSYAGLTMQDLTTWTKLGEVLIMAISNPYVLALVVLSVYNAITDPTTKGLSDSYQARTYAKPKED